MVVLSVKMFWAIIGTGDFFYSFFSTVGVLLEREGWGSRFPAIMNELYWGRLPNEHLDEAEEELAEIRAELKKYPRTKPIWDFEDPSQAPPWEVEYPDFVTDLSNAFVTASGKVLLDIIGRSIQLARKMHEDVVVESVDPSKTQFIKYNPNKR